MHIQDENNVQQCIKLIQQWVRTVQPRQWLLTTTRENIWNWIETKKFIYCKDYNATLLWRNLQITIAFWCARSVVFSKNGPHYGPWSGFPYYDLTTSHRKGMIPYPLFATSRCTGWLCGLRPLETSPVPSKSMCMYIWININIMH